VVGAAGGADATGDGLEFAGVEDVIDGCGEEGVVAFPGGLEAAAFSAVAESGGGDEVCEEGGPRGGVEITHEEDGSGELGDGGGGGGEVGVAELRAEGAHGRDGVGNHHGEERAVVIEFRDEEGMAAGGHRPGEAEHGILAVEGESEIVAVGEVGDVGMGFLEGFEGLDPFVVHLDDGDDVGVGGLEVGEDLFPLRIFTQDVEGDDAEVGGGVGVEAGKVVVGELVEIREEKDPGEDGEALAAGLETDGEEAEEGDGALQGEILEEAEDPMEGTEEGEDGDESAECDEARQRQGEGAGVEEMAEDGREYGDIFAGAKGGEETKGGDGEISFGEGWTGLTELLTFVNI